MKITREKACQRLHHRVHTPLHLQIDGRDYAAQDWSLGGFCVADWDRDITEVNSGKSLSCKFELPFQGFDIGFAIDIEVVRVDEESRTMAAKFVSLDERQTELMSHFVEQLVRGSMTPIQDTILRIDSPVTPVSTKPDPSPMAEVPTQRLPVRLITMSLVYLFIGVVLFSLATITVYDNFLSLRVNSAVTNAPVEPIVSLVDGRIRNVNIAVDEPIREGQTMLSIESPDLKNRIDESKIFVEQKKLELEALRQRQVLAIETSGSAASKEARLYQIDIDLVQKEISLAMQSLVNLYDYRDNLSIVSPGKGKLVNLYRHKGALVKRGETIAVFERNQTPKIHAFLTEEEARPVTLNLPAQIKITHHDQLFIGRVIKIKPDANGLLNQAVSYRPVDTSGRNVLVEIEVNRLPGDVNFRSGLPVEVVFPVTPVSRAVTRFIAKRRQGEMAELQQLTSSEYLDATVGETL
jgi:multidrug resistance efflux pump